MQMYLPPTPPDDTVVKNPTTPPALVDPLTPDNTPPGMRRGLRHASNEHSNLRAESIQSERRQSASPSSAIFTLSATELKRDGKTPEVPGAYKEAEWESYIPVEEPQSVDRHDNLMALPMHSPEHVIAAPLNISEFPIRQKPRKRVKRRSPPKAALTSPGQSSDWNDIPPEFVSNRQIYEQIQQGKMAKFEAAGDENAVEVVVLQQDTRIPSLRHMKKRRSLRADTSSLKQLQGNEVAKEVEEEHHTADGNGNRRHRLRHLKAFEPSRETQHFSARGSISNTSDQSQVKQSLRHERRPLSAGNRSQTSSMFEPTQPRHVSLPIRLKDATSEQRILRHFSPDLRIENNIANATHPQTPAAPLRHASPQLRLENMAGEHPAVHTAFGSPRLHMSGLSPSIRSHRFANTQTPMSVMSDRTDMELCVAKNVTLFPHSNDSVFLIENHNTPTKKNVPLAPRTFRPLSFTFEDPESASTTSTESLERSFSTPEIHINGHVQGADSPLTNPRAAPAPPVIKFTPPTPSSELDRQTSHGGSIEKPPKPVQRSGSLINKAKRLSGSLITPFFPRAPETYRVPTTRSPHVASLGNDRLHPMWLPTQMWDDDYSDEYDDYDMDGYDTLPAGGDTSEHPAQRSLFPRHLSVRMPGFRGDGGFLLGNSLGVERHGTNRRRHHVEMPARKKRRFTLLRSIRDRVKERRASRDEAIQEKRRALLKDSIGAPDLHSAHDRVYDG